VVQLARSVITLIMLEVLQCILYYDQCVLN